MNGYYALYMHILSLAYSYVYHVYTIIDFVWLAIDSEFSFVNLELMLIFFGAMHLYGNSNVTKLSNFKLKVSKLQTQGCKRSKVQKVKAANSRVQKVKATNSRVQKVKAVNSKVQKYRGQFYLRVHTITIIKYLWVNKLVVK